MARETHAHVPDAELSVLKALWREGPSPIRRLTDLLYPDGGTAHYATVQKLLERLEAKGLVARKTSGRLNVYTARVARAELVGRRLRETADRLCDGSLAPLLTHLVGSVDLTREELAELRELVDRLEEPSGRRKR